MAIIRQISNCPITGLEREAKFLNFTWDDENSQAIINVKCYLKKDGEEVANQYILPYVRKLCADNSLLVNPNTGDYILLEEGQLTYTQDQINASIGEYDFLVSLAENGPVPIIPMIIKYIDQGDTNGRFN